MQSTQKRVGGVGDYRRYATIGSMRCVSGEPGSRRKREQKGAQLVIALVTSITDTEERELRDPQRGSGKASRARQVAMYLLHTWFGFTYQEVGALFARDRTTVAHACRRVESLRDLPHFDRSVTRIEALLDLISALEDSNSVSAA